MSAQTQTPLDAQKELLASAYSSAAAYTNIILGAGYAGFFATWAFMRERLTPATELWAALLVLVSLLSFILFEVYKSFYISRSLLSLERAVGNTDNFSALLAMHKVEAQRLALQFGSVWLRSFWFILLTGVGGGVVLICAVIHGLLLHYF
jgi:hypothetical protein